jgi:hypothetical protein
MIRPNMKGVTPAERAGFNAAEIAQRPPLGSLPHPKFIAPISKLLRTEISSYSEISAEKGLRSESLKNGRSKAYSISEGIYGKEAIGLDAERCTRDRPRIRCIPGKPQGMTWPPRQLLPCKCCASPPHILNRYWPDKWAASSPRFGRARSTPAFQNR